MQTLRTAVFAGSFDPITLGHLEIINRGLELFDKIIIGVGINSRKQHLFPIEQRLSWIQSEFKQVERVEVAAFDQLTVDFARKHGAKFLLRGLRNFSDLEYETHISRINQFLNHEIETVFLVCNPGNSHISSTFVREIYRYKGKLEGLVPPAVVKDLYGDQPI